MITLDPGPFVALLITFLNSTALSNVLALAGIALTWKFAQTARSSANSSPRPEVATSPLPPAQPPAHSESAIMP